MYYVFNNDRFLDEMYDKYNLEDSQSEKIWKQIVDDGLGRFFDEEYYIISESKSFKIGEYSIERSTKLSEWVSYLVYEDESVEICDGLRIKHSEVMDRLLEWFEEDVQGTGTTYADIIYNAENPKEKVYELLNTILPTVMDLKLEKIKIEMNNIVERFKNKKLKWD